MKFNTEFDTIIYCKDYSYQKKFDKNSWYCSNGVQYYKGYIVHREDGPAIVWDIDDNEWYINGKRYLEEEYMKIKSLKSKSRVLNDI